MENNGEVEKSVKSKKLTASAVIKKYNLTPEELDEMLSQIYETLEEQAGESSE